ncbi:unnamed protein product [Rhizophagus irregularis]|nr:unnamed protein product [Rhizophagus irregularis]
MSKGPRKLVAIGNLNSLQLGKSKYTRFICEGEGINSGVLSSSSAAIHTIYGCVFGNKNKTKYSGATMLGFHDSYMIQHMLNYVDFHPFTICLYNITIIVASIPYNNNYEGIFQDGEIVKQFQDITAFSVWNQTQLLQNCNGINLFRINHPLVNDEFENYKDTANDFWYSLCESLDANPNDSNGKIQILSIVAEISLMKNLMKNLQISPKTVHTAREHHHKNGPGCKVLDKPIIVCK